MIERWHAIESGTADVGLGRMTGMMMNRACSTFGLQKGAFSRDCRHVPSQGELFLKGASYLSKVNHISRDMVSC